VRIQISLALFFLLAACDESARPDAPGTGGAPAVVTAQTRDQLLLRVPRRGGPARVYAYPRIDSLVWTASEAMPAISRTLAFDQEAGTLAYVDTRSIPRFLDLRTGVTTQGAPALRSVASRDAWNVYGIAADGQVVRATPAAQGGEGWRYKPPARASAVFPQSDGSILIVAERPKSAMAVWRLFPPDREIVDSATLPNGGDSIPTQVGDRLYLAVDSGLVGIRGRGRSLDYVEPVAIEQKIISIAATPSGDRFFVATDSSNMIRIVNPYRDEIAGEIELPGQPALLRMDPYGRAIIARPAAGDSAWVIALGTDRVIGTVRTTWRSDLPVVAPDGSILVVTGRDVSFLDGGTLEPARSVRMGGDDFWHFFEWGGFRPRAAGIDEPVSFEGIGIPDSTTFRIDSLTGDTIPPVPTTVPVPTQDTTRPPSALPPLPPPPPPGFTVSFATLLDQGRAEDMAREIRVEGRTARVISSVRDGTALYRVVLGPFPSRNEADRIGRASGRPYWVYEGTP
jgi:hypothetical protein